MIKIEKKENCCGCSACANICPTGAIEMLEDEKGFKYPKVNIEKCINCKLCEKVCPIISAKPEEEKNLKIIAGYNKNIEERINSSSGGIFALVAQEILNRNGIVFGAAFDDSFNVYHTYVETKKELSKLMGSKYVQSDIKKTYKKVKEFLQKDRYVLFTGTPCQIEGLISYLQKDYNKLYTQDIICHGVPSPYVWNKYKEYREKKDRATPKLISFRNKDNGWNKYNLKFKYLDSQYCKNKNKDLYMQSFLRNTILRDSCYQCHFKKMYRISDITLADYWGIKQDIPKLYDNKGASIIIINSEKGKELFDSIKEKIIWQEIELKKVIKSNNAYISSACKDTKREIFFNNIDKLDFKKNVMLNSSNNSTIFVKIKRRISKLFKI